VDVVTTADVEVVRTAAFNDRSAVGFMFELRRAGVGIPGDISVVGYDDITMAALPFIDLTTVGQDATATAQHAFEHVSGRLEENTPAGNEGLVTPYLAVRSTTAEPASFRATPAKARGGATG
jgi:DNA-binding LacI/PurR family transcriptional regulator